MDKIVEEVFRFVEKIDGDLRLRVEREGLKCRLRIGHKAMIAFTALGVKYYAPNPAKLEGTIFGLPFIVDHSGERLVSLEVYE